MGATNARLAITDDCESLVSKVSYKMSEFKSLNRLLKHYIVENNISDFEIAGIMGVAAPVISNEVNFVNNNFSFNIKEIESSFFQEGLKVLNDVQMQTYGLNNCSEDKLIKIGNDKELLKLVRKMMEDMLETMYEIPDADDISSGKIDEKVALGESQPIIHRRQKKAAA